ncbi:ATP-dependent metallopeptidase FtsH/Yme1/Tma family protein, partial [Proteiniphilum sp. UBA5510]
MSNTNNNKQDKQPTLRPKIGGPNNSNRPFNPYWIYAAILAILMGMWFFGQDNTVKEVKWSEFQQYVRDNRVKSVVVFSNKETAEAVIREESASFIFGNDASKLGKTPSIKVNVPSTDAVSEFIDKIKDEKNYEIEVRYDTTSEFWGILITFAPFILLIVFWVWMMRRMQGGAGGGSGVFSVGKSKA